MYVVEFEYHLNATTKFNIVAECKVINDTDVFGLRFKFVNDEGETIRVGRDPILFEDIEAEATTELLDEYYNKLSGAL